MPQVVGREQVRELGEAGARLVEVLPKKEYERVHLPGAANIPLTKTLWEKTSRSWSIVMITSET
jgi:rhodanese-related sulfurtransferase